MEKAKKYVTIAKEMGHVTTVRMARLETNHVATKIASMDMSAPLPADSHVHRAMVRVIRKELALSVTVRINAINAMVQE